MVVADTDLIIGLLKGSRDAQQAYKRHAEKMLISSFTWYELMIGCCKVQDTRAHLEQVVHCLEPAGILAVDDTIATLAARNAAMLARKGKPIGIVDNFIAATCVVNGETLVTRNVKHFNRIPGLRVEKW